MQQAASLPAALSCCLPGKNRASSLPKPCHHQSQRYTRSVMPLAGEKSKQPASPNEETLSKKVGPQRFEVGLPVFVSAQPPCLHKSSKAGVPPLLPEGNRFADKNHPPWDGLKICQFAFLRQGPFASAEYLVQLTSSLAQKVCLGTGKPLSPRGMAEKPSTQPAGKKEHHHGHRRIYKPLRHRIPPHKSRHASHRRTPDQRSMGRSRQLLR